MGPYLHDNVAQESVLSGEVSATKAAQHELEDIKAKVGRVKEAAEREEGQALENRKAAEKLKEEAQAARVRGVLRLKPYTHTGPTPWNATVILAKLILYQA